MNERSRPARRLPDNDTASDRSGIGGQRAWRREVRQLSDEELQQIARGLAQVDRAVENCRRARAA
jgi:hypothetical protein